jgi:GntR family transcriptional regulator
MILDIQPQSPIPIYEQIVSQVIFGVASGALEPGAMIPSVRDMAMEIVVNPNTVARAWQELERRGVVAARRGKGMEVTSEAVGICRSQRQDIVRQRIRDTVREAVFSQLSQDDIRKLIDEELARANGHRRPRRSIAN